MRYLEEYVRSECIYLGERLKEADEGGEIRDPKKEEGLNRGVWVQWKDQG